MKYKKLFKKVSRNLVGCFVSHYYQDHKYMRYGCAEMYFEGFLCSQFYFKDNAYIGLYKELKKAPYLIETFKNTLSIDFVPTSQFNGIRIKFDHN